MGRIINYLKKECVFVVSLLIAAIVILIGLFQKSLMVKASGVIMAFVSDKFGWLYILFVAFLCFFLAWLAFGRFGKIKLGKDSDQPEYSNFQWFAMLFCGGTGIGLVFWSIAEPLSHYVSPPDGYVAGTEESMSFSIRTCFLHWGVTQWSCFALVGLGLAYFQYRKKKKGVCSVLLSPLMGDRPFERTIGKIIDIFTVVVSFAGVATSLGLGVSQICGGLEYLFGIPNENQTWFSIIIIISSIFLASSVSGVDKGIKILSSINTYVAFLLLGLAFIVGPHVKILNMFVNGIGQHLQNFVGDLFMIDPYGQDEWITNWRIFYYAWFIAWCPFVGLFIARISRGRTIREFVLGVVGVPTIFTIIWLSVFGTIAFDASSAWSLSELKEIIESPQTAVFIVFNEYPLSRVTSVLTIVLLAIFFVTSADSATYSLSMMTSDGSVNPPVYKKVIWAIVIAGIAYTLLSVGSLKPLQTISIAASLPFLFIMIAMCPALVKELRKEIKEG